MSKKDTIGLIGVGLMGHGIALNLGRAGYPLCFLDHPGNQPVTDLIAAGAQSRPSAKAVAEAAHLIILCVTGTPQIESVLAESDGVLAGLQAGSIVIDCSTAIPSSTEAVAQRVEEGGGHFVDAAMTRTPKEAAEGRLNLIVGATDELFRTVRPVLESFSESITHGGPLGSGHKLKLLHNYVSLGFTGACRSSRRRAPGRHRR